MSSVGNATNVTPPSKEHAEMLATKWWTGDQFQLHGENNVFTYLLSLIPNSGISCREGPFTLDETECVRDVLSQYQMVRL
jgi:hypothetical protein